MNARIPLGHLGYWVAAAVVVLMGWTLYGATIGEREAAHRVNHTLEVLQYVSGIDESLSRAESAQRGYLLAGTQRFVAGRDKALAKAAANVEKLKTLTANNASRQPRLAWLEEEMAQRVALMRENADLRTTGGMSAGTGRGQEASGRIYSLTGQLRQEENHLLDIRREAESSNYEHVLAVLFAAVALSLSVMIPGYIGFIVEARARAR